jgi:hypothetical protein
VALIDAEHVTALIALSPFALNKVPNGGSSALLAASSNFPDHLRKLFPAVCTTPAILEF